MTQNQSRTLGEPCLMEEENILLNFEGGNSLCSTPSGFEFVVLYEQQDQLSKNQNGRIPPVGILGILYKLTFFRLRYFNAECHGIKYKILLSKKSCDG